MTKHASKQMESQSLISISTEIHGSNIKSRDMITKTHRKCARRAVHSCRRRLKTSNERHAQHRETKNEQKYLPSHNQTNHKSHHSLPDSFLLPYIPTLEPQWSDRQQLRNAVN